MRPRSIRLFEMLFLGGMLLSLVSTLLMWPVMVEQAGIAAGGASLSRTALGAIVVVGVAISVLIELLLWFFTARRASRIALWLTLGWVAWNVWTLVRAVQGGGTPDSLPAVLGVGAVVLQLVAVALLFAADARAWFADHAVPDADVEA